MPPHPPADVMPESNRWTVWRLSRSSRIVVVLLVGFALAAWFFMAELVVFSNWVHKTATAPPQRELEDGLTPDEQLMYTISHLGGARAEQAVEQIVAQDDKRFIPVLIELLRANEAADGLAGAGAHKHVFALDKLSGVKIRAKRDRTGDLSAEWIKWYASTDYEPPPGFITWKGQLLGRFDPIYGELLRDEHPSRIRVEEIQHGGVDFDVIAALDTPKMIPAAEENYLRPDEPVFGIVVNGDVRAYPQRILDWHEMVNDIVGEVPVSLSYCSLCGAAIAFDGRASDGTLYTFGSSGLLYRSNKLMYDRQTKTLWNQFSGRTVLGPLVPADPRLTQVPVVVAEWQDWRGDHPETLVMDRDTGYERRYFPGEPYGEYYQSSSTMFPVSDETQGLPHKSRVFGLRFGEAAKAYPLDDLTKREIVNDTVGRQPVVIVATRDTMDVEGETILQGRYREEVRYNAGGEVRVYDRGERVFRVGPDDTTLLDSDGNSWEMREQNLVGPDGAQVPRLLGIQSYWFGWLAFNKDTEVYKPGDEPLAE